MKTGELKVIPGDHVECVDCGTNYPCKLDDWGTMPMHVRLMISSRPKEIRPKKGKAFCNGHEINLCPTCRPDSKPWTNGRGA